MVRLNYHYDMTIAVDLDVKLQTKERTFTICCYFSDIDECLLDPCLNNGTCVNTLGSFKCLCESGYEGPFCQTSKYSYHSRH